MLWIIYGSLSCDHGQADHSKGIEGITTALNTLIKLTEQIIKLAGNSYCTSAGSRAQVGHFH